MNLEIDLCFFKGIQYILYKFSYGFVEAFRKSLALLK